MNDELIELISTYMQKLSCAKAILQNTYGFSAKELIKSLTNLDIDELEKQLKD